MARRRRGRKGKGRKGKAIPLLMLAPVLPGFAAVYAARGSGPVAAVRAGIGKVTGIDVMGEVPFQTDAAMKTATLAIVGFVGHKVATKLGINRQLKKVTLGYIQL